MEGIDGASLRFYSWEARYRGYQRFPFPVPLELPFTPYIPFEAEVPFDDGHVTRWWQKKRVPEQSGGDEVEWKFPKAVERFPNRIAFMMTWSGGSDSSEEAWEEIFTILSSITRPLSFEIYGTASRFTIQITTEERDYPKVTSMLRSYFPDIIIREGDIFPHVFDGASSDIALCDFGLEYEFMIPIGNRRREDSLLSLYSLCDSLREGETLLYQVLFSGTKTPIARDMLRSLDDGQGGSFFEDTELLDHAHRKLETPLFACGVRMMCQSTNKRGTRALANDVISVVRSMSDSGDNRLIPLSNLGYSYKEHSRNVFKRASNRPGMILSARELASIAHTPSRLSISDKLVEPVCKTKASPEHTRFGNVSIGVNEHLETERRVYLREEDRFSHTHILGSTGMGKSTVLVNLVLGDVNAGYSAVVIDPHGDLVDAIISRIPKERSRDIILIDPSDTDFPLGFNLLSADSESEKVVLSSDIVATFKRYSTSWGDRMTSVLSYAVDTFLSFEEGGTLLELRQFLIDKQYREKRLKGCRDPLLQAYWLHDFPHLSRSSLTPLLMRFDTFLRSPVIRNMMAQRGGINLAHHMDNNKIVLIKLAQGMIGEENARLLGTLFVAKIGQGALARQRYKEKERRPCFVYLDEFQHILTPSIGSLISGARKFKVGVTLVHQDLMQLNHERALMHSAISNTNIRMSFRLAYEDARTMAQGFSSFESEDIEGLERGQAIMRVGGREHDFNVRTDALPSLSQDEETISESIIRESRAQYGVARSEVEKSVAELLKMRFVERIEPEPKKEEDGGIRSSQEHELPFPVQSKETEDALRQTGKQQRINREHTLIATHIQKLAQDRGFRVVLEEETDDGGRVDVAIHSDNLSIAFEVSVHNSPDYEVKNIQKCLKARYDGIVMVSNDLKHLDTIQELAKQNIENLSQVVFCEMNEMATFLQSVMPQEKPKETLIKGYRVKSSFAESGSGENLEQSVAKILLNAKRKKK